MLKLCEHSNRHVPEIGYEIQGNDSAVVAELELAWPSESLGVAISDADRLAAIKQGWEVWSVGEALEQCE